MARQPKQEPDDANLPDDESSGAERDYSVRAVERVCLILNLLQESVDGITLNEVAQTTGLPKSSAFRYLWTLEHHRYVERDEINGLFRLGLGFVGMQSRHLEILRERARPSLEELRDEFGETANLGLLDGDHIIYIEIVESRRGVRLAASRGDRDPLHSTALGKAIAAHLPAERVKTLLATTGMPSRTSSTITSPDDFMAELALVRKNGYAIDNCENEVDGRCVAAPLLGTHLPAAISVSGPSPRFSVQDAKKVAKKLIQVAAGIATNPDLQQDRE
ncbi:IclR family transcriptional regulator [Amycolatopsis thermoflava]|uniref:IclR family transcriptional regulator n=1 Tax=Amycolatopsis thermoflava TaxID=84480 RepID=UPI003EBD71AF